MENISLVKAQQIAHMGSWVLDLINNQLSWSDEIYRIFEINPEEFNASYEAFLEFVHPDDREFVDNAYTESVRNKTPYSIEHRLLLKDGKIKYVQERCETTYDNDGNPVESVGTVLDITERKQTEQSLKESEERWRSLTENSADFITLLDTNYCILYANHTIPELEGLDVVGQSIFNFMYEGDQKKALNSFEKVLKTGLPDHYQIRYLSTSGVMLNYDVRISPVKDEHGNITGLISSSSDITDHKAAEDALIKSEEKWRSYTENSPNFISIIDSDYIIQYVNQTVPELTKDQVVGKCILDFMMPEDQQGAADCYQRVFESGTTDRYETRYPSASGEVHYFEVQVSAQYDIDGNIAGLITTSNDITERKQGELALIENEAKFRSLFQSSVVGMVLAIGDEGVIKEWNSGAEQIFGYNTQEILNQPLTILIPERFHKAHNEGLTHATASGKLRHEGLTHELIGIRQNGEEFPLQLTIGCWKREEQVFFSAIILDTSIRKKAEDELKAHKEHLEELVTERTIELTRSLEDLTKTQDQLIQAETEAVTASHAKSEFLAHMSHEIRTPMNGIIAMSDLLLNMDMDDERTEYLRIIKHSGTALLAILNDILDISKIEAGKMVLDIQRFKLKDILNDVSSLFKAEIDQKNIHFHCMINVDVPDVIISDSTRLRQILANLLGNAAKFTPENGNISLHIGITENNNIPDFEDTICLEFKIEDSGIGIPKEQQKNIFEAFTQADKSVTRKYGGTGLGLQICQRLCQLMDGDIQLHSSEGKGTTVIFRIQVKPGQNKKQAKRTKQTASRTTPGNVSILLVEDNPINQKVAYAILNKLGYCVEHVDNGEAAVSEIHNNNYDIILMDCQMPIMDGYEATRQLRKDNQFSNLPIIAMTASATTDEQKKCAQVGMNDFIAKPIDINSVKNILMKWH